MAEYYNENRDSLKDHQGLPVGKLAKRTVLVDNELTRVSFFELEPGDNTGWHKHESDYATPQELSLLPGVPTVADTVPGFEGGSSCGLFAPKNTPADVIDRLNAISVRIVNNPEFRDRLASSGLVASAGSVQSYKAFLDKEAVVWGKVLKTANISLD